MVMNANPATRDARVTSIAIGGGHDIDTYLYDKYVFITKI